MDSAYERQFINWMGPIPQNYFFGKSILDAGCGMGRNSFWALKYGAKELIAFDNDENSVAAAKKTLAQFPNTEVLMNDIYQTPWDSRFDIVFSIGVIHHLKNPKLALQNLTRALKPGGLLWICVYSYNGNELLVQYVNPIRKYITSRIPAGIVHVSTYFISVPLWLFLKITGGTSPYMRQIASFKFWHVHSILFDQLIPEIANYWKKEEVAALFRGLPISDVKIVQPGNKQGWVVVCKKS